jgi:hypothetical protein
MSDLQPTPTQPAEGSVTPPLLAHPRGSRWKEVREWVTAFGTLLSGIGIIFALWAISVSQDTLVSSTTATIYSLGQESTRFFIEHPETREYFYKDDRGNISDDDLRAKFDQLSPNERAIILLGCELLLDFMQITFEQRKKLPDDDWDSWWKYFCDLYDESPIIQLYLDRRPEWYPIGGALKNKEKRCSYYRGKLRGNCG